MGVRRTGEREEGRRTKEGIGEKKKEMVREMVKGKRNE